MQVTRRLGNVVSGRIVAAKGSRMPAIAGDPHFVRFGGFALDLRSGELTKNDRLLLPEQPFRILASLVRSPGALVTREHLRRELWRPDTFVDFEHSLNAAIKRLRQALGDSAATPQFIETLPRRGYRFKAVVDAGSPAAPADAPINAVDLVLAEFASLNNLADRRDLPRVLDAVARALADGGWFCFDVNTARSLRVDYPQTFWVEDSRFRLVQPGSLEADGRRARLDFEWLVPAGRLWRHVRETLWHVCWTDAEIRQALRKAGFGFVRRFDGFDVRPKMPGVSRGTDAYYLARKTKAGQK